MKKFLKFGALALLTLFMAACEETPEPQPQPKPEPEPTPTTRPLEVEAIFSATSKASLSDAMEFDWEPQNCSLVLLTNDAKQVESKSVSVENGVARFSFDIPYETTSARAFFAPNTLTPTQLQVKVAHSVTLNAAGSTQGLALSLVDTEPMLTPVSAPGATVNMALATSLARYVVYSSEEALVGEKVLSVTLEANAPLAGTLLYDLAKNTYAVSTSETPSQSVVATLHAPYEVGADKDTAKGIFMELLPAKSAGAKVVVKTDVAKYTFDYGEQELTFECGAVHTHYFDLKNATSRLENGTKVVTYNIANLITVLSMSALGGEQDMGYYLASVDGVEDTTNYTADYYANISFEIEGADGAAADWVSGKIVNNNHPVLTIAKNDSTEGRTATVKLLYTPSTKEYAIENPVIATIEVAQNGATATHSLTYQWFGDAVVTIPGGGLGGVKGLGYFLAYLDGSATAVADAEAIEPFFKTVEVTTNADWCVVNVVGGNFNNLELVAIEPNPSTTEERRATITATFKGDTDTYIMTPDNTAFTVEVVQQPSKAAGERSELYYTTANLSTSLVVTPAGVTERDLGYFFAMVDGSQTDDGGSKWFASLVVESNVSWLTARIGGNHVYLTADSSAEADWRKGVVTLSYPESDSEVEIVGGNPVVTIEVTQMPASSDAPVAVYTFGNDPNNLNMRQNMTVGAGGCTNAGVTWMSVYKVVDGVVDGTRDNTFGDDAHAMTYTYVDAEGNSIDWLSASVGGDWLNYSAAENASGKSRVGYIHVHPATAAGQVYEGYNIPDPCLVVKVTQSAE